jgi:hypothetical protein
MLRDQPMEKRLKGDEGMRFELWPAHTNGPGAPTGVIPGLRPPLPH